MDYTDFITQVTARSKRNKFEPCESNFDFIPDDIKSFYRDNNPVRVIIGHYGVSITLHPVDELQELQKEYDYLDVEFVFATSDGDPIFINNGCVYTCPHGVKEPQYEKKADSFIDYLISLVE